MQFVRIALVLGLCLASCGGRAESGIGDRSANGSTASGGSGATAGGVAGSAGSAATDGNCPTRPEFGGYIRVGRSIGANRDGAYRDEASAQFYGQVLEADANCKLEQFGACSISTCEESEQAPDGSGTRVCYRPKPPNPGSITIADQLGQSLALGLDYQGQLWNASSSSIWSTQLDLSGGKPLTFNATDGDVPAFSAELAQPRPLLITSPLADPKTGEATCPKDRALEIRFDGGAEGIDLMATGGWSIGHTRSAWITCRFPTKSGTATIPSEVVSKLNPPYLTLTAEATETITTGDYKVDVTAFISAVTPDGTKPVSIGVE